MEAEDTRSAGENVLYGEHARSIRSAPATIEQSVRFPALRCHYDPGKNLLISDRDDAVMAIPLNPEELKLLKALQESWPHFLKTAELAEIIYADDDPTAVDELCIRLRKRLQIISKRTALINAGDSYRLVRS